MNLSMKWLSDYIDVGCDIKEFVAGMTMSGSKVEGYDIEGSEISNVVVGKVISVVPHEDSDHLVVCQLDVMEENPVQIVTGASNVFAGAIVPVALNGATLPGGVKIKKGKLRGVESNGMLCSLGELGLTIHDFPYAEADGIFIIKEDCEIGADIHTAIGINDTSVEFEITSNRPDCLSVLGLAREAHATFNKPLDIKKPDYKGNSENTKDFLDVAVLNDKLCSRYISGIVKNVKIGPSPRWMRERLRASGVRPINNFVDITNYVMLEYGHPMHAFDIKFIEENKIVVRNAVEGEKIVTLDGVERKLDDTMLVIADGKKPVAVAGVMGGEYSGIMEDTVTVAFEAACFDGACVRRTAKKLGMRTDASARYEKGLDPKNCYNAICRAFQLVEELGCGEVVGTFTDINNDNKLAVTVDFDPDYNNTFLGTEIDRDTQIEYLSRLGFKVEDNKVISPSYRIDIECKADIAEEIARIYGYNNIPSTIFKGVAKAKLTSSQKFENIIESSMVSLGCNQILTYSFTTPKHFDKIMLRENNELRNAVTIINPLGEDTSVMRTTAIPSMLEILSRNYNYRNPEASLFEIANEYIKTEEGKLPNEPKRLIIGGYGEDYDFYTLKGIIVELLKEIKINDYEISAIKDDSVVSEYSVFHPGRCAIIIKDDVVIGYFGEVHPTVLANYEIGTRAYVAKLNISEIEPLVNCDVKYKPLPKFPASTRDLSLICDEKIPVGDIEKVIKSACGKLLESIKLFDVYQGKQIEEGKKSVSYSLVLRSSDATLTDEQAESCIRKTLKALEMIGVSIRV